MCQININGFLRYSCVAFTCMHLHADLINMEVYMHFEYLTI